MFYKSFLAMEPFVFFNLLNDQVTLPCLWIFLISKERSHVCQSFPRSRNLWEFSKVCDFFHLTKNLFTSVSKKKNVNLNISPTNNSCNYITHSELNWDHRNKSLTFITTNQLKSQCLRNWRTLKKIQKLLGI